MIRVFYRRVQETLDSAGLSVATYDNMILSGTCACQSTCNVLLQYDVLNYITLTPLNKGVSRVQHRCDTDYRRM